MPGSDTSGGAGSGTRELNRNEGPRISPDVGIHRIRIRREIERHGRCPAHGDHFVQNGRHGHAVEIASGGAGRSGALLLSILTSGSHRSDPHLADLGELLLEAGYNLWISLIGLPFRWESGLSTPGHG